MVQLPIESLVFDDIDCVLKTNGWALEVVLALADQLATYDWRLNNQPDPRRRSDLPANELKKFIIPRLIAALLNHTSAGKDITPSIERFLREQLAHNLLAGGYPQDARAVFEICQRQRYQSEARDESMRFWIYFCLYRTAFVSKKRDDIKAALDASKTFTRPEIDTTTFQNTIDWLRKSL